MSDFEKILANYRLATAEIFYHIPDHPTLLQSYVWQEYDLNPHFSELKKFLHFWNTHLDGKIHSVTVAHIQLIKSSDWQSRNLYLAIN